ncbi:MAG: Nif-specific regulatory protein [Candidatus Azotimanducaceae bacterium]|jgi:Nif-specific regulatory protein
MSPEFPTSTIIQRGLPPKNQPWFPVSLLEKALAEENRAADTPTTRDTNCKVTAELNFIHKLKKIAVLDINLLLSGETGTGKTCLAHLLHVNSSRAEQPFVEINCAAIPELLLESELFGAVKGAHSSAFTTVKGKIAAAEGGTLFLDEVNLMSLEMQAKLLQFLNDGHYYPLGSTDICQADIRLICSTNTSLEAAIAEGDFRADLYHRVNTYPVQLRPLRERHDDIIQIALANCQNSIAKHKLPPMKLSAQALASIKSYKWPGNLRELSNTMQRACIEATIDESVVIEQHHLGISTQPPKGERRTESQVPIENSVTDLKDVMQSFKRTFIEQKLEDNLWNVSKTAKSLGLSRGHLHTLMNSLELDRDVNPKHSRPVSDDMGQAMKRANTMQNTMPERRRRADDENVLEFRRNTR